MEMSEEVYRKYYKLYPLLTPPVRGHIIGVSVQTRSDHPFISIAISATSFTLNPGRARNQVSSSLRPIAPGEGGGEVNCADRSVYHCGYYSEAFPHQMSSQ